VPAATLETGLEDGVRRSVAAALSLLERLGATRIEVRLPHLDAALSAYYVVAAAEASTNLARYDGVRFGRSSDGDGLWARIARTRGSGFGPEVKRRIVLGTYALSAGYREAVYLRASRARRLVRADYEAALARCDVVAGPTSPTTAFPLGARLDDPLAMYLSDVHTVPPSLAGLPAISLPCGLAGGLPVGLQLAGRPFAETELLRVAAAFEAAARSHGRVPPPNRAPAGAGR
jgi:aspartyl-tRNA(Asn)/glutamyl-tRNA(Gln) amidotransferase subunit A